MTSKIPLSHAIGIGRYFIDSQLDRYLVAEWLTLSSEERRLALPRRAAALALRQALTYGISSEMTLDALHRGVMRPHWSPSASSSDKRLDELVDAVERGSLCVLEVEPSRPPVWRQAFEPEPPPPVERPPTWFEIRVVWDDTGEPVSGLGLVTDFGKGNTSMNETGSDGRIRHEHVQSECEVRSKPEGITFRECAVVVGSGERPPPPGASRKRRKAPLALAELEVHRVRSGETLESVAARAALTWKKLGRFNFGTDDPAKLNASLASVVGCHLRTADGKNFMFDSSDEPGVVLVPRPWRQKLMQVATHHTIRIMPVRLPIRPARFST